MTAVPPETPDEWQRIEPVSGLIYPGYTFPAVDEIKTWDVSDKIILEWGGGHSTIWWATRAAHVFTIDAHNDCAEWIRSKLADRGLTNATVVCRWPDPEDVYLSMPEGCESPDIVVIDGSSRTACLKKALTLPRPITIIFDNWQQDGVYTDAEAEMIMAKTVRRKEEHIYTQPGYVNPSGIGENRPWKTAIWKLS